MAGELGKGLNAQYKNMLEISRGGTDYCKYRCGSSH